VRALIFHDGALGDVLLSLPCITAIGKHDLPPDIVCRSDVGRLLVSSGIVLGAFSSDSRMFSTWYAGRPDSAARELIGGYGRLYVFTRQEGSDLALAIASAVPDTRVIITVPPEGDRKHVAEYRLRQLEAALRDAAPVRLTVDPAFRQQAGEALERAGYAGQGLVVLQPGSGGRHKCWPLERYFALAERLADKAGAFMLFLTGPAEGPAIRAQIRQFVGSRTRMATIADADLPVSAGLLAQCGLFVGNDSGITHLAAAIGAPVIALFGPTDPVLWAPRGGCVRVIAAGAMEGISVEAVLAAADDAGARAFSVSSPRDLKI